MTKYRHPGPENDRLFQSSYDHVESPEANANCEHCAVSQLKKRPDRTSNPQFHYGIIASGNQVMKHGQTRDEIAQSLGALCFEMEAGGLMNHVPCLVVRGICDYSDSHKNKTWQGFAAMAAAAYTYQLLRRIPPKRIDDEQKAACRYSLDTTVILVMRWLYSIIAVVAPTSSSKCCRAI